MLPKNLRLILASGSPRRDDLLNTAGLVHEILVSGADEDVTEPDPRRLVEKLSARKAGDVFRQVIQDGDFAVIGADTVVALDGVILGKPRDEKDARKMLEMLSGRAHHVCTGVTLHGRIGGKERVRTFSEVSTVHVASLSQEEIQTYIATGEPMDKAGAYGIQGAFCKHVTHIEGDYFNIVGLPVSRLYHELKAFCIEDDSESGRVGWQS